jgi:hypothetical protein
MAAFACRSLRAESRILEALGGNSRCKPKWQRWMTISERPSMFSPFAVRSCRFQWSSDLLTSCATEMETIVLGWFIFVETNSVPSVQSFAT